MVVNPAGAQQLFDGQVPNIITARCNVGATGGELVYVSGAAGNISSGANSYAVTDLSIGGNSSGTFHTGIVITPGVTASGTNNYVAVATNGTWIVTSANAIIGGQVVYANGANAVVNSAVGNQTGSWFPVGRALCGAGSEQYALVKFI